MAPESFDKRVVNLAAGVDRCLAMTCVRSSSECVALAMRAAARAGVVVRVQMCCGRSGSSLSRPSSTRPVSTFRRVVGPMQSATNMPIFGAGRFLFSCQWIGALISLHRLDMLKSWASVWT